MKKTLIQHSFLTAAVALATLAVPADSRADLISRMSVSNGSEVSSAYVFQGARDMKRYKSSRITSSKIVPHFSMDAAVVPSPVLSALATPEIQAKPRFGYGSDYSSDQSITTTVKNPAPTYHQPVDKGVITYEAPVLGEPVYQADPIYESDVIYFQGPYSTTEYWPVSPFYHGYHCDDYGYGPSFGPARLFSRIRSNIGIRTPFFSLRVN